jgi:hypothetical protein
VNVRIAPPWIMLSVPLPAGTGEPQLSTERRGSLIFAYPSETTKGSSAIVRALLMATVSSR